MAINQEQNKIAPAPDRDLSPQSVARSIDDLEMLQLRVRGYSIPHIARSLGLDPATVSERLKSALREIDELSRLEKAEALQLELQRIDECIKATYPFMKQGIDQSVRTFASLIDRRLEYLNVKENLEGSAGPSIKVVFVNDWRTTYYDPSVSNDSEASLPAPRSAGSITSGEEI